MNAELLWYTILISFVLDIGIIWTSVLFHQESYELIEEYANVSAIWRENRVTYCGKCPPPKDKNEYAGYSFGGFGSVGCQYGPDVCYQEKAEAHAALLDYHELLARSSWDGFGKYGDTYNFNVSGSGERYIAEKEEKLHGYPKAWVNLTIVVICFAVLQIISLVPLGCVDTFRKVDLEKVWIGTFSAFFLLQFAMFITATISKSNYVSPGLQYESKYKGSANSGGTKTWGGWFCGLLGINMTIDFLLNAQI